MLGGLQTHPTVVSANAAAALTENQGVVLSYSSGVLTATGSGATDRIDGYAAEAKASGEQVAVNLHPGTRLLEVRADGAITAGALVYPGATGYVSATANGVPLGVALNAATTAGDFVVLLAKAWPGNVRFFYKVADATDASNGYVSFTHGLGAAPSGFVPYAVNGSTGAPRVIASVTNQSTNTVSRVTVTSVAANDIVSLIVWL